MSDQINSNTRNSELPSDQIQTQNANQESKSFFKTPMRSNITNSAREMHNSIVRSRVPSNAARGRTSSSSSSSSSSSNTLFSMSQFSSSSRRPTPGMLMKDTQPVSDTIVSSSSSSLYATTVATTTTTTTNTDNGNLIRKHEGETVKATQETTRHRCNNPNNPECAHCGTIIIPSPVASFPVQDTPSITIDNRWSVYCSKNPILNAAEIDDWEDRLKLTMPEMIFGNNRTVVEHKRDGSSKPDFRIEFNAFDALKSVKLEDCGVRVAYASKWQDKRTVQSIAKNYDWTYTPVDYHGTITTSQSTCDGDTNLGNEIIDLTGKYELPLDKLSKPDRILFYDDMVLFEDELGDNGISIVNVKIRVMNERLLLLSRFFLRVDEVLFRVYDTRLYIEYDENLIIREYKEHELDYASVLKKYIGKKDPKLALRDSNLVVEHLTLKKRTIEQIKF